MCVETCARALPWTVFTRRAARWQKLTIDTGILARLGTYTPVFTTTLTTEMVRFAVITK